MVRLLLYALITLGAWLGVALPLTYAATYGLVVGIDDYQYQPKLQGAANDAQVMAAALRQLGVARLIVLLDSQASRKNILSAWEQLVHQAHQGDTLVFSYAGHGAQEPERIPGNEADQKDEVLVLAGFDYRSHNGERIIDDEIHDLFQSASHLKIIFVADACYSGSLTRGSLVPLRTRTIGEYGPIQYDALPRPPALAGSHRLESVADLPHVTFFSASSEFEVTPEVSIEGKIHGALSWSFSQALRGAADDDHNGTLSKGEMAHYVLENVRMRTEYKQHPQILPKGEDTLPLLTLPSLNPLPLPELPPPMAAVIHLQIVGVDPQRAAALYRLLQRVAPGDNPSEDDLLWQVPQARVLNALGDIVAHLQDNSPRTMQQIVDKWLALRTVQTLSARHSLRLRLHPGDDLHHQGAVLTVQIDQQRYPYLTLFNLTADGTVQFLYPLANLGDPLHIALDRPFVLPSIAVTPPFGAEHLVAVVSQTPLQTLHSTLQQLHHQARAAQAATALQQQVATTAYQMSVLGLYTAP